MALMCAVSISARDHNEINGTWTMLPAKSDFAGQPVVQTGTVTTHDSHGDIVISRSFKYQGATEGFLQGHLGAQSDVVTIENYGLAPDSTIIDSATGPNHKPIVLVFQCQ